MLLCSAPLHVSEGNTVCPLHVGSVQSGSIILALLLLLKEMSRHTKGHVTHRLHKDTPLISKDFKSGKLHVNIQMSHPVKWLHVVWLKNVIHTTWIYCKLCCIYTTQGASAKKTLYVNANKFLLPCLDSKTRNRLINGHGHMKSVPTCLWHLQHTARHIASYLLHTVYWKLHAIC